MSDKIYQSLFVPEQKIDIRNYITEMFIVNYLEMVKKPKPNSPFWRKDISKNDPWLQDLSKRYIAELSAVGDLLEVFDAGVVAKYIKDKHRIGFRLLKKENKIFFIYELYLEQIQFNKLFTSTSEQDIINIGTKITSVDQIKSYSNKQGKLAL